MYIKRSMTALLVSLGMAGASQAIVINLSLGESAETLGGPPADQGLIDPAFADLAPGMSGLLTEVIGGETWNNIPVDTTGTPVSQALFDSLGSATSLSVTSEAAGEFLESRPDPALDPDVGQSLISAFGSNGAGTDPTVTISGFAPNQELTSVAVYVLGNNQNLATMLLDVNGDLIDSEVFTAGADLFMPVLADSNGDVVITATNAIAAIIVDTGGVALDPADLDQDGDVDDADFGLFFAAFSGPGVPTGNPAADLDGDNDTDDADFGLAFAAFTGPGGGVPAPEPTSLALLGFGGLLAARRRRA